MNPCARTDRTPPLFEIGLYGFDQFFGAAAAVGVAHRIDDMKPDVVFDYFSHQARERAARRDDEMQHVGATLFLTESTLDSLDLSADPPDPVQQFQFFALGVRQR
jgi:hypothetical protein